ncbi:bile acid:sodium symporter [Thermotoga maritima MSB8]|uniref:Arsenical-resistance protein ACR3 n=1 Tax=Thermotoga maritima (strain ATCC 43589 / DSM 3109 / JCM 10099 / NBRC 100826 / MSB8) TaxID=243274 RepID=Q9X0Q5_THEMA|nr:bile acid:sodium symporter [Thermotoga maritima]AAD36248.1 conserved hypothetical protein [Thermotoga maritima MSB8]AGL50104.1 Arsenical-resistance protein ACR3 [Thermotoga maritima MSB8]AHD18920.1 bile acid:sodium symporter [Thermotoga maritima MSB8]AKE27085.1 bile acid:sodium symporter [Thermotoga maritima]AKE28950.1 bile acid:sodium symporter [Thermotoga maritima MSB8]
MNFIQKMASHFSKNMLFYTLGIVLVGTTVSLLGDFRGLSKLVLPVVFLMIYPMMINVSFESLKNVKYAVNPLLVALALNFVVSPLLFYLFCLVFRVPTTIRISLILLAVAPSSSMGLGYVGLSKGNIVSASVIVAFTFLLSMVVYPVTFHFLGVVSESYPFTEILKDLLLVLILPLTLGVLTREFLERKFKIEHRRIKPLLSLLNILALYLLISIIFLTKGKMIVQHWKNSLLVAPVSALYYLTAISSAILLNRYAVRLSYEDHQAVVFTTVSKNVALTIGLLATSFASGQLAMYPAIVSLFQIIFLMSYLHLSERIQKWWSKS